MLHQDVARARVTRSARGFTEHLFQLLAMAGGRAIAGNGVNGSRCTGGRVASDTHGAAEFLPRRPVHKGIGMPRAQVAFIRGNCSPCGFHGCLGTDVRDEQIIPGVAILMAKHDKMLRRSCAGIGRLKPVAQLGCLAKSSLGEMDVVNVGSFAGTSGRGCTLLVRSRLGCLL